MNTMGKMAILAILAGSQQASSQSSSDEFTILRHSISSGGGVSTGGFDDPNEFRIVGSIGQVAAGTRSQGSMNGELFSINSGFFAVMARSDMLFNDSFEEPQS